jgi:hypothetical protein
MLCFSSSTCVRERSVGASEKDSFLAQSHRSIPVSFLEITPTSEGNARIPGQQARHTTFMVSSLRCTPQENPLKTRFPNLVLHPPFVELAAFSLVDFQGDLTYPFAGSTNKRH